MKDIKIRIRDPVLKWYMFYWITIDECLRQKLAFLPQKFTYEIWSQIEDVYSTEIYDWDLVMSIMADRIVAVKFEHWWFRLSDWDLINNTDKYEIVWNIHGKTRTPI
jgi:hypothetical protein